MITLCNFKTMLSSCLGFGQPDMMKPELWSRTFRRGKDGVSDCVLSVDFEKQRFCYGEAGIDIGGGTTANFSSDSTGKVQCENFVVFECVVRLLGKGYKACDIFLEKRHTLGHSQKSGRLDVTVMKEGCSYLIIECKTPGIEYKKARKELFGDSEGKQLFSYWTQARSTKWLLLYASDYDEEQNVISFDEEIIRSHDDPNIELLASKDPSIGLYGSASEATDAWRVWDETYHKETYKNLVFGEGCLAYGIGVRPLLKSDLRRFTQEDGFTNTFREILRHNAISDKENAFNKLLSLFICKFVDEARCSSQDIVAFQYKDGQDDYYSLYERLLALFHIGMKDYLKEDVFYLENDYITRTLDSFTGKKRKALETELTDTFRKTKMLSCQVFAFREVYNEMLFLQNGKVLVEIVKLMQQYQFAYTSKEQLLGDLFENLLGQGFKQEAGQFFTPTPITRFVWNSLPYERFLNCAKRSVPRVIDFACGSGHFLTEGIAAVSDFYRVAGLTKEAFPDAAISRSFFGIEKDNRLAKVSKIAMILNGALEGQIKADDGLEHDEDFLGKKHSFDILVANPPYSVDSFKMHESVGVQKSYETIKLMSIDCARIQNVFVERMEHLMKPGGVSAIVLPSPFLTNDESDTCKAREILLGNFAIRAIAEFGNKAFAETGTNTVILFLEHFDFPPKKTDLLNDTVDAILSGEILSDWEDREVFEGYLSKINVSEKDYLRAMSEKAAPDDLKTGYFKSYATTLLSHGSFAKDAERALAEKCPSKKAMLLEKIKVRFYAVLKETERAKILAFALTRKQKTVLVKSPTDNDEQERFLGYKFSRRRNSEGLSETGTSLLTNSGNRADKTKVAYVIKNAFAGDYVLPPGMACTEVAATSDLLDFSKPHFDWSISLSTKKGEHMQRSRFELVPLGSVCDIRIGGTPDRNNQSYFGGKNLWVSIAEMNGQEITDTKEKLSDAGVQHSNAKLIGKGTTLLSFKLSIGKTAIAGADLYTNEAIAALVPLNGEVLDSYLFHLFSTGLVELQNTGKKAFGSSLNSAYLRQEVIIPKPDVETQKNIIAECETVDAECAKACLEITKRRGEIDAILGSAFEQGAGEYRLKDVASYVTMKIPYSEIIPSSYVSTDNMLQRCEGVLPYRGTPSIKSVTRYCAGDILVSNIRPYLKKSWLADRDGGCSQDVLVFRITRPDVITASYLSHCLKMDSFFDFMMSGKKGMKMPRGDKEAILGYKIVVPSLARQKDLVLKISACEGKIAAARATMDAVIPLKRKIFEKAKVLY